MRAAGLRKFPATPRPHSATALALLSLLHASVARMLQIQPAASQAAPAPAPTQLFVQVGDKRPRPTDPPAPPHSCPCDWIGVEFERFQADLIALKSGAATLPADTIKQTRILLLNDHVSRLSGGCICKLCSICYDKWSKEFRLYAMLQREGTLTADVSPQQQ